MRNIKLVLEYDGSQFYGFQKQPHHVTVQEALEKALSKFFNTPLTIRAASGRTDTGVHALAQVVNFRTPAKLTPAQIQKGLNACLPPAIAVREVEVVPDDFHARYSAKEKTYEYRIWNEAVRSPLNAARCWHYRLPLDVAKMKSAAKLLTGRHDFRSFCASNGSAKTSVRRVKKLTITKKGALIIISVTADGFLYHMVRNIAGTLVEIGAGRLKPSAMNEILKACDRTSAGRTAPAHALTLVAVNY